MDGSHTNLSSQEYNLYNGGNTFQVMNDWRTNGAVATEKITTSEVEGGFKIAWGQKGGEWSNVRALVKNGTGNLAEAGFKRAEFTLSGTSGKEVLAKVEFHNAAGANVGAQEVRLTLDGTEQKVEVNIEHQFASEFAEIWVLVFPEPGAFGTEGAENEILLKNVVFDQQAVAYVNVGNATEIYLDKTSYAFAQPTVEGHVQTLTLNNQAADWGNNLQYLVTLAPGVTTAKNAYVHFHVELQATAAVKVMVKPYDSQPSQREYELVANTAQTVDFDVDAAVVNFAAPTCVFVNYPDAAAYTGTLTITNFKITVAQA